jgi:GrpB-like predicted nucleotidyltransferase (UPF0157 family)
VPGLAAKPIVDILVEVATLDGIGLEPAGYVLRVREDGHLMFRTPELDVQVHVWPTDSPDLERHIVFRDACAPHPRTAPPTRRSRRELATRDWPDLNFYAEAKGPLIREIERRGG